MNQKWRIREVAVQDLQEIASYIELDNPNASIHVLEAIWNSFEFIAKFPLASPRHQAIKGEAHNIRRRPVQDFPSYLVYYFYQKDQPVDILRIIHASRLPDPLLKG